MSKRNSELFDLIEAFIENRLDDAQRIEFEKRLAIDAELFEEVEKHKALHQAMLDNDSLNFRKKLQQIAQETSTLEHPKAKRSFFNWRIAALVAVIFGLGVLMVYQSGYGEQTLFESYFTVYPLEDTVRGNEDNEWQSALAAYDKKEYKQAAILLEARAKSSPKAYQLKMYLGSAYLELGQPKKALSEFESLTNNATYGEQAKWYMAMTYLKMNENTKVIALLEDIIAYDGINKNDAMNLHEKLIKQLNPNDI